jgi:hypothetical protein
MFLLSDQRYKGAAIISAKEWVVFPKDCNYFLSVLSTPVMPLAFLNSSGDMAACLLKKLEK